MDPEKKKRLEAAGWRETNIKELFGLSDADVQYIKLKAQLAASLRAKRKQRKMGQVQLAKLIESSQSRVAKMESGDTSVSLDLLINSLYALGVKNTELGRIIAHARPSA